MTWHNLRQQMKKPDGRPTCALADFVAPKDSGLKDYLGAFVVTAGIGEDERAHAFEAAHDDYSAILFKALCDRLAEAFAEHLHSARAPRVLGLCRRGSAQQRRADRREIPGIRPAPGYPACPEHSEKAALFEVLDATEHIGVDLTENFAMWPGAAVSGFYLVAPRQPVFRRRPSIERDQVEDYARRKGWDADRKRNAGWRRIWPTSPAKRLLGRGQPGPPRPKWRGLPALLQHLLQPEQPDHGLGFADLSAA